jgi:DcuC family C4-dicarboxylate transporter
MNEAVMYILSICSIVILGYMLIKKHDIKIVLFAIGLVLTMIASFFGVPLLGDKSIAPFIDPFTNIINEFKTYLSGAGLTILILGGYTTYMNGIGANDMTVRALLQPIKRFKNKYILLILVFLIGNLLSIVVPSASNLAIILLATLYPVLRAAGISKLSAAAVIATTATIMPTPLGSDNVAIAEQLQMPVFDYVFKYHAVVSIPTIIAIAVIHACWQYWCDKKDDVEGGEIERVQRKKARSDKFTGARAFIYALLPLLPILLLIIIMFVNFILPKPIEVSVPVVSIISFVIAFIVDLSFTRLHEKTTDAAVELAQQFFAGMGGAMDVVILTVAAAVFVDGLTSIGLIKTIERAMQTVGNAGVILPLILVLMTALIVVLSGSGTSLFFAMVPLMVPLATAAGISALALSLPMGMAGNLLRAISPVSAVIMITAGTTQASPMDLVKRTSVPMIFGTLMALVLSLVLFS